MHYVAPLIQTALACASLLLSGDGPLPDRMTPEELEGARVAHERAALPVETQLVIPDGQAGESTEPRSGTTYRSVCYAYLKENGMLIRRFSVHVQDREGLPLARNAARFMSLIWSSADRRFGTLCRRLRAKPVDIWLTRAGQGGGEQTGSSIYVYDVQAERAPIEWARELAHEYGHYLLPGASGYTEPESWSNGLLGERLFLLWLRDDLKSGQVKPEMAPFVKPADVEDYCEKQSIPLIDRIRQRGPDTALIRKRNADAMDELSALLLYTAATYGPKALLDLLVFMPPNAAAGAKPEEFLTALTMFIADAQRLTTRLDGDAPGKLLLVKGRYRVSGETEQTGLMLDRGAVTSAGKGAWTVTLNETGWRTVTVTGGASSLTWERQ